MLLPEIHESVDEDVLKQVTFAVKDESLLTELSCKLMPNTNHGWKPMQRVDPLNW